MTLSKTVSTVLSGIGLSVTYFYVMLRIPMLSVIILSVIILSVVTLSVIILSVIILSIVMLSVVMLSVVMVNYRSAKCRGVAEIRQASKILPYVSFLVVLFVFE
jgi:hypothetical protein